MSAPDRIEQQGNRVQVGRYGVFTRLNHWTLAITFVALALSGMALFHPTFWRISDWFGGGPLLRWLHPVIGCVLIVSWLVMFVRYFLHNLPSKVDFVWLARLRSVLAGDEEKIPEIGRYNAGQKLVFWAFSLLVPGLFLSGVVIWDEYFFAYTTIEEKRIGVLAHSIMAVVMISVWIVHAYAAIWVRGTLQAMVKGTVTGGWAFRHHRKWLREVARGEKSKTA